MDVSGQFHDATALPPEPELPIGKEVGWGRGVPGPVWTGWRREKVSSLPMPVIEPQSSSPEPSVCTDWWSYQLQLIFTQLQLIVIQLQFISVYSFKTCLSRFYFNIIPYIFQSAESKVMLSSLSRWLALFAFLSQIAIKNIKFSHFASLCHESLTIPMNNYRIILCQPLGCFVWNEAGWITEPGWERRTKEKYTKRGRKRKKQRNIGRETKKWGWK